MNQNGGRWKLGGRRMYEISKVYSVLFSQQTTITKTTQKMERGRTEDNTQPPRLYGYGLGLSYENERC